MLIDIHVHTAAISDLGWGPGRGRPATPEELIDMYDEVGIDKAVMLPFVIPECNLLTQSNEDILMIYQEYPDRFIPFCNIDPRLSINSPDLDLSYVINHYKEKGCRGIGELTANLYFDDPRVENLFDHAERCEMPLTFHVTQRDGNTYGLIDDYGLPRFESEVKKHPRLTFLCHSTGFWAHMSADIPEEKWEVYPKGPVVEGGRVPELLRRYPNLCGDLSAGSGFNAVSRDPDFGYAFMTEFQDQLCFGTDVCRPSNRDDMLVNLKRFMDEGLKKGKLTQEVHEKIAFKNAQRILKL